MTPQGKNRFYRKRNGDSSFSSCAGEPVYSFMGGDANVSLSRLVDGIRKKPDVFYESPWYFRHRNLQSYDFGLHNSTKNRDQILEEFDLVIIMERMQEGLVLLKNELCMEWEDLEVMSNTNQEQYSKSLNLSDDDADFVKSNLLNLDLELYNSAVAKFEKKVSESGGSEKLIAEYNQNVMKKDRNRGEGRSNSYQHVKRGWIKTRLSKKTAPVVQ